MKNRYKRQLDTLFSKAQQASAGTRLLSGDDIRNLLADSASAQQTTTTKQGVKPMAIIATATGFVALITAGTMLFTGAPHQKKQPVAPAVAQQQTTAEIRQPKHYSTPGIAGKEKAGAVQPIPHKPAQSQSIVEESMDANVASAAITKNSPVDVRGVRMLELTDTELLQLGLRHREDTLDVYQRTGKKATFYMGISPRGFMMIPESQQNAPETILSSDDLRMITDDLGNRRMEQYSDDSDNTETSDIPALSSSAVSSIVLPNQSDASQITTIEVNSRELSSTKTERSVTKRTTNAEELGQLMEQKEHLRRAATMNVNTDKWIAILVKSRNPKQDESGRHWRTNYVVWYEPTPEVVAALPERYRTEIQRELMLTSRADKFAAAERPNGGFIGLWQTASGAITASSVYPNPVTDKKLTLSYTLSSPRTVNITLRSITGVVLAKFASKQQQVGTWTEEYPIGDIHAGMYLVSIETDNGEYSVQRLIVE